MCCRAVPGSQSDVITGRPGEGLKRERPHEFCGPFGQDHINLGTGFDQSPDQDAALIGGNAARHAEGDVAAGPHGQASERRRREIL